MNTVTMIPHERSRTIIAMVPQLTPTAAGTTYICLTRRTCGCRVTDRARVMQRANMARISHCFSQDAVLCRVMGRCLESPPRAAKLRFSGYKAHWRASSSLYFPLVWSSQCAYGERERKHSGLFQVTGDDMVKMAARIAGLARHRMLALMCNFSRLVVCGSVFITTSLSVELHLRLP